MEDQVEVANVGLCAFVHDTTGAADSRGYFYDLGADPPAYRPTGEGSPRSRAELAGLADVPGKVVILQCTPVGSERRVARVGESASGPSAPGPVPENVVLEPMAPAVHWVDVTRFRGNLSNTTRFSLRSRDVLWDSLTDEGTTSRFGVPAVSRHEPPRRFRVSADHLRPGARLRLGMPTLHPRSNPRFLEVELFPTSSVGTEGRRVWETTLELAPLLTYALLNGGPWAPRVTPVLQGDYRRKRQLDPDGWNFYSVEVVNEDGTTGRGGWQVLSVQDTR